MALSKSENFNGINVANAYIKVETVNVSKEGLTANVTWRSSADAAPFKAKSYSVEYDINGVNPLAQAYNKLKAMSEFDGATDV